MNNISNYEIVITDINELNEKIIGNIAYKVTTPLNIDRNRYHTTKSVYDGLSHIRVCSDDHCTNKIKFDTRYIKNTYHCDMNNMNRLYHFMDIEYGDDFIIIENSINEIFHIVNPGEHHFGYVCVKKNIIFCSKSPENNSIKLQLFPNRRKLPVYAKYLYKNYFFSENLGIYDNNLNCKNAQLIICINTNFDKFTNFFLIGFYINVAIYSNGYDTVCCNIITRKLVDPSLFANTDDVHITLRRYVISSYWM